MGDRKRAIIEAAIKTIANYGLNKTNAQMIAKELGIAQSSIFYHFPQQQLLFDALLPYINQVNRNALINILKQSKATNYFDRLCEYIHGNLLWAINHKEHVTVLLYYLAEGRFSETINTEIRSIVKAANDQIYHYLVAGIAEQEFQIKGNVRNVAKFINQSVNGTVITHFQLFDEWDIESYMADLIQLLKSFILLEDGN